MTRRPLPLLSSLCALYVLCAASPAAAQTPAGGSLLERGLPEGSAAPGDEETLAQAAIAHIEAGELEAARRLLDELLVKRYLRQAGRLLGEHLPEDALTEVDRALALAPRSEDAALIKAEGSLALAEKGLGGRGAGGMVEGALHDALEFYSKAAPTPTSCFGASRAAWLLGKNDEALAYARQGRELADDARPRLGERALIPERVHADAAYAAYLERRTREGAKAEADALYAETEDALMRLLGRTPDDPWVWSRLSDLYEWGERLAPARDLLVRGLERHPADPGLHERLVRVTRKLGGREAVLAACVQLRMKNPEVPLVHWYEGVELFSLGLEQLNGEQRVLEPATFDDAEQRFRTARTLDAGLDGPARGYEVICRNARGWCAYYRGDLEAARSEFLSMNDVLARGIEWSYPGELESGLRGLFYVVGGYNERKDWLAAGEVSETQLALEPDEPLWANNAGFFLRDAAVDLEFEGARLCRAAAGEIREPKALGRLRELAGLSETASGSPEESAGFAAAAEECFARAGALMERSSIAYDRAAELAPEDVRVINDTALVLVYYLHRDLARARTLLERAVALGEVQVAALEARLGADDLVGEERTSLESELWELKNAWGDAHENLGVLSWLHEGDDAQAETWLVRAIEIGPSARPDLGNNLLPMLRGEKAEGGYFADLHLWGHPCAER